MTKHSLRQQSYTRLFMAFNRIIVVYMPQLRKSSQGIDKDNFHQHLMCRSQVTFEVSGAIHPIVKCKELYQGCDCARPKYTPFFPSRYSKGGSSFESNTCQWQMH